MLDHLYESGVTVLNIDGKDYNFEEMYLKLKNTPGGPQEILNTLMTGKMVRDIGGFQTSALAYGNAGVTLLGLPVDLVSMVLEAGKAGLNYAASLNAPEGVDDPDSPNYDPDFYMGPAKVSPFLGSQNIRNSLRAVGIDLPESVREIPEEFRSQYQFDRVVGENIGPAAALYRASLKAGMKLANNPTMHPVLRTMAENPNAVRNGEALALLGASSGAALMQELYPNNPYGQLIGELAGGFGFSLAPAAVKTVLNNSTILNSGKMVVDKLLAGNTVEGGRNFGVQELLLAAEEFKQGLLKQADQAKADGNTVEFDRLTDRAAQYEPAVFLDALNKVDNSPLPAGTVSDNEMLVGAQNSLLEGSNDFSGKVDSQISAALANIEAISRELLAGEGLGDLGQLMQSRYIQTLLQAESGMRSRKMLKILETIPEGNPEAASLAIQGILRDGKNNLRQMETFWWNRVDKSVQVDPSSIARIIEAQRARLPEGASLGDGAGTPNQVLDALAARAAAGESIDVGEILAFRSYFLNKARMAGSGPTPDKPTADSYDKIAASAVELLNDVKGFTGADITYARKFSALMNEKYNRFWVKTTSQTSASGGFSNDPRLTQESMMSGSFEQTRANIADATDAAQFADDASVVTVGQQTEDALEAAARKEAADTPADNPYPVDPSLDRAGLLKDQTTSMSDVLTSFWEKKGQRMRATDTPKSAEEAIIANERGDVVFDSTTRRFPENEARTAPPEDVYEGEGVFSMDNGEVYGELALPSEKKYLGPEMNAVQEKILLGEIRKLRDTSIKDSIPTEQALNTWLSDNAELVERFPQVKQKAEDLLAASEEVSQYLAKADDFVNSENFNSKVAEVFNGTSPDQDYGNLVQLIKDTAVSQRRGPEDVKKALDHLRASTFDMMLSASMKEGNPPKIDFLALTQQLFSPVDAQASKGTTRIEIMQKHGLIDGETVEAVGLFLNEAVRVQRTTEAGSQFNSVLSKSGTMLDNLARIAGANVGALSGSGQASIQTAAIGSQFMKNLVSKFPQANAKEQLRLLFLNPSLLADYISKNVGKQKRTATVIQEGLNDIKNKYKDRSVVSASASLVWNGTKYVSKQIAGVGTQTFRDNQATLSGIVSRPLTGDDSEVDTQMMNLGIQ